MMVETDILYAYIKREDWLKPTADKVILQTARGGLAPFTLQEKASTKYTTFQEKRESLSMN